MKIGILATAFECEDELDEVLKPWLDYKHLSKDELIISVVSAQFKQYAELGFAPNNQETVLKLINLKKAGKIKHLTVTRDLLEEWDVRNLALKPLLDEKCDIIWLLDCQDEFYKLKEINDAIEYIDKPDNLFYSHFKIEFKNFVGDKKHFVKGFKPNRIWRTKFNNLILDSLYYDNNCKFVGEGLNIKDEQLASKTIPFQYIAPLHYTWISDERSKRKIAFQLKRWSPPNGNGCSFRWNNETNSIEFDPDFHKRLGIPIPELYEDK